MFCVLFKSFDFVLVLLLNKKNISEHAQSLLIP